MYSVVIEFTLAGEAGLVEADALVGSVQQLSDQYEIDVTQSATRTEVRVSAFTQRSIEDLRESDVIEGLRSRPPGSETEVRVGDTQTRVRRIEPLAGEVRYIRASIPPERAEEVSEFWRSQGRSVIEGSPGCIRARGFIDPVASEFVLMIWWQNAELAEEFRLSEYHERAFVDPLGEDVIRLGRTHLLPIDGHHGSMAIEKDEDG